MALKNLDGTFECSYCGSKYPSALKADNCREAHDLIYIPITRQDLNALIHLIIMSDSSTVSTRLFVNLQRYARKQALEK
jgi:hypothetical protein